MFLGLTRDVWFLIGGVVLLAAALIVVEKYDLYRKDPMKPIVTTDDNKLPLVGVGILALSGFFLLREGLHGA